MSAAPPNARLEWITKRDSQLVPFDPDKICRSLFAAGESLGQADAFLARELTDSVVHFLGTEVEEAVPTTGQVAEVVVKVVRELGQPALALAYARYAEKDLADSRPRPPAAPAGKTVPVTDQDRLLHVPSGLPLADALRECARQYALQAVFTRDLLALQNDGLIRLFGLERPGELAATLLDLHRGAEREDGLFDLLQDARQRGSSLVVLDGPEHLLAPAWPAAKPFAPGFARRLDRALRLAGMRAVVNLNAAVLPSWADDGAGGPLFHAARSQVAELRDDQADRLAREWSGVADAVVRIDWHVGARDFTAGSPARDRLSLRLQEAARGANLTFVFDRERRAPALVEGIARGRPALLLQVGLNLPRLAEWTGTRHDPAKLLTKLESLTALALTAGAQKREFLRQQLRSSRAAAPASGDLGSGFLLDRAALVIVPLGLDCLVQTITGHSMTHGAGSLEFARRLVQHLRDVIRSHTRSRYPEACIDGCIDGPLEQVAQEPYVAGLTPWDPEAAVANQLRAASVLHAVAEAGTLHVILNEHARTTPEELLDVLSAAHDKTDIVRLRFVGTAATQQPLPFLA